MRCCLLNYEALDSPSPSSTSYYINEAGHEHQYTKEVVSNAGVPLVNFVWTVVCLCTDYMCTCVPVCMHACAHTDVYFSEPGGPLLKTMIESTYDVPCLVSCYGR